MMQRNELKSGILFEAAEDTGRSEAKLQGGLVVENVDNYGLFCYSCYSAYTKAAALVEVIRSTSLSSTDKLSFIC